MSDNMGIHGKAVKATGRYLERRGYEVLDEGYECDGGEVDLVARDEDGTIAFVGVSARRACSDGRGHDLPEERPDRARFERIAAYWFAERCDEVDVAFRFDAISMLVLAEDRALIRHHVNALAADACE